jgi:hypothetical protein
MCIYFAHLLEEVLRVEQHCDIYIYMCVCVCVCMCVCVCVCVYVCMCLVGEINRLVKLENLLSQHLTSIYMPPIIN